MDIIARFTQSFLTADDDLTFSRNPLEWALHSAESQNQPQTGNWDQLVTQVHELQTRFPSLRVLLLLPTEYTLVQYVALPKASRRKTLLAIPYLVEDSLVGDASDEHIVWSGAGDGQHACCVTVRHSIMHMLFGQLQASGIQNLVLLPDGLPLLKSGYRGIVVLPQDRALLLDTQGVVCLPLRALMAQCSDTLPGKVHICRHHGHPAVQNPVEWPQHVLLAHHSDYFTLLQSLDLGTLTTLNLLSGPYRLAGDNTRHHRAIRHAMMVLLCAWSLHIISDLMLVRHYAEEAKVIQQQTRNLYAGYFPSAPYPSNMARDLDTIIRAYRETPSTSSFLLRHTKLVEALDKSDILDAVKPIDIHYNAGSDVLNTTLHIPDIAFSEMVMKAIEGAGVRARLIAANHIEDGATIRIALSGPASGPGKP